MTNYRAVARRRAAVLYLRDAAEQGDPVSVARVMHEFNVSRTTAYGYLSEAGVVEPRSVGDRPEQVAALRAEGLSWAQVMDRTGLSKTQARYAYRKWAASSR